MRNVLLAFVFSGLSVLPAQAQSIEFSQAKFHTGDNMEWKAPSANDSDWKTIDVTRNWDPQGVSCNNSYAWYRVHFVMPKKMLEESDIRENVLFELAQIDDADEAYLNGQLIGKTGKMPSDGEYQSAWEQHRRYLVKANSDLIKWDAENVLSIRVYNGGEPGGIFGGRLKISVPSRVDGLAIQLSEPESGKCRIELSSQFKTAMSGTMKVEVIDFETGSVLSTTSKKVTAKSGKPASMQVPYDGSRCVRIRSTFTDGTSKKSIQAVYNPKYILTPKAPAAPRFNTTGVFGVRPGSPVIYRFPVSGERPMKFSIENLPNGLTLDAEKGVLSGSLRRGGDYHLAVVAENAHGKAEMDFTLRVGDNKMAQTPPMGWNSWNCWGLSVTQERVISSAKALIDKGLADYGYSYINIDDGWEAPERNADGTIAVNEKFPSMKDLGDWLHSEGLKFGIYSSPGDRTCGGYLGSIDHEKQDAESYNSWGIDYLKYDWCGYGRKHEKERDNQTVASFVRPYLLMEEHLRNQPRDIFYSLCQYGMADVWKWGHAVDANSWRTTGDIADTWESMFDIGFKRNESTHPYAQPGHWNDPDMLIVGKVGWSNNLRDTRLTPDEQYTHISLWSIMASNMLIGCDIAQMDDFTVGLLCNNEVNAINQDIMGKQGHRAVEDGNIQIWIRDLYDGSMAIGIFNVGLDDERVDLQKYLPQLGIKNLKSVRDVWRQQDISTTNLNYLIAKHGVKLLKVKK